MSRKRSPTWLPGVHVDTLYNPLAYSPEQVRDSCRLAAAIGRGPFLLVEEPAKCVRCLGEPETFCGVCEKLSD